MNTMKWIGLGVLGILALPQELSAQSTRMICADPTQRVEAFASGETSSWAIPVTTPNGMTCLLPSGRFCKDLTQQARGEAI